MSLLPPFWFIQRQAKAEAAGANVYRVTAPQMREAYIAVRQGPDGRWTAALREAADGPDLAASATDYDNPNDAWGAAFELFRNFLVV